MALATLAAPALAVGALAAFGAVSDDAEPGLGSLPAADGLEGSTVAAKPEPPPAKATPLENRRPKHRLASTSPDRRRTPAPDPARDTGGGCAKATASALARSSSGCDGEDVPGAGFAPGGTAPEQPDPVVANPQGSPGSLSTDSGSGSSSDGTTGSGSSGGHGNGNGGE
jgi:hypothetical protein